MRSSTIDRLLKILKIPEMHDPLTDLDDSQDMLSIALQMVCLILENFFLGRLVTSARLFSKALFRLGYVSFEPLIT